LDFLFIIFFDQYLNIYFLGLKEKKIYVRIFFWIEKEGEISENLQKNFDFFPNFSIKKIKER